MRRVFRLSPFVAAGLVVTLLVGGAMFASASDAAPAASDPAPAQAAAPPIDAAEIYGGMCAICHKAGMNGAPKFGNKLAWKPRIANGKETLYKNSIEGLRAMPPRGGFAELSDAQVHAAVDYMVNAAGGYQ